MLECLFWKFWKTKEKIFKNKRVIKFFKPLVTFGPPFKYFPILLLEKYKLKYCTKVFIMISDLPMPIM